MTQIKGMISYDKRARVHYILVDNPERLIGDAKTLCGRKIAANTIYETGWPVDCKKCLKVMAQILFNLASLMCRIEKAANERG